MLGLAGAGVAVATVAPPATPAGRQLAWVFNTLNSGKTPLAAVIKQHFSPAFLKLALPDKLVQALAPIAEARPLRLSAVLRRQGALGLQVRVEAQSGAALRLTIQVAAAPPHLIEGLLFEPVRAGA